MGLFPGVKRVFFPHLLLHLLPERLGHLVVLVPLLLLPCLLLPCQLHLLLPLDLHLLLYEREREGEGSGVRKEGDSGREGRRGRATWEAQEGVSMRACEERS